MALAVAGLVALVAAGAVYLVTFPDGESRPRAASQPAGPGTQAFADDPTPEELAEGEVPVPREDPGDWPPGVDCLDHGRVVTTRDPYTDVQGAGGRPSQRPSASLDLGAVRLARSAEWLCAAWVARRPPRGPMVVDLSLSEDLDAGRAWVVRVTLEPEGRRFVEIAPRGGTFERVEARLDVVRRYGRVVLPASSLPEGLPLDVFRFRTVSRSPLMRGGRHFFDCVPADARVAYPSGAQRALAPEVPCEGQP